MTDKLEIEYFPINDISPYDHNPRRNQKAVDIVAKSISAYGFRVPIILGKGNVIIAGHTRLMAAKKLGLSEVPVVWADDLTEQQQKALRIMDNRSIEYSDWDWDKLKDEIIDLKKLDYPLDLTGLSENEISKFIQSEEDKFEPSKEAKYKIEKGEIWQLGRHRLMNGDATIKEDVDKLMNGNKADMVFTDPPYGIDVVKTNGMIGGNRVGKVGFSGLANTKVYRSIIGDDKPFDPAFLLNLAPKIILWGANNFASKLPDNCKWLVWDKKGDMQLDNDFSDVELAWTNLTGRKVKKYIHIWAGMTRQGDRNSELKERVHPTQKPVGLNCEIIKDFTDNDNLILDLFGGSGSTLIACEQTNRICYMMEIDSHYCSVIIERWENLTNQKAEKL